MKCPPPTNIVNKVISNRVSQQCSNPDEICYVVIYCIAYIITTSASHFKLSQSREKCRPALHCRSEIKYVATTTAYLFFSQEYGEWLLKYWNLPANRRRGRYFDPWSPFETWEQHLAFRPLDCKIDAFPSPWPLKYYQLTESVTPFSMMALLKLRTLKSSKWYTCSMNRTKNAISLSSAS